MKRSQVYLPILFSSLIECAKMSLLPYLRLCLAPCKETTLLVFLLLYVCFHYALLVAGCMPVCI